MKPSRIGIKTIATLSKILGVQIVILMFNVLILSAASPVQPEFSNFESVSTNNMVNEFDGSFTYNLPLLTVPGPNGSSYSISLSYHSGLSPEADASWVGYGWTLNPGSIIRNTKGYPDDYYDNEITIWNKVEPNISMSLTGFVNPEIFSLDIEKLPKTGIGTIGLSATISYNNHTGYAIGVGFSAGLSHLLNMNLGISSKGTLTGSFSGIFHPKTAFNDFMSIASSYIRSNEKIQKIEQNLYDAYKNIYGLTSNKPKSSSAGSMAKLFNNFGFGNNNNYPSTYKNGFSGSSFTGAVTFDILLFPQIGADAGFNFLYTNQTPIPKNNEKVYGFMYSGDIKHTLLGGADNSKLMDYFTEKDTDYHERKMFMGTPFGNHDIYNVSGEGVTGSFRAYNSKIGQFRPKTVVSNTSFAGLGISFDAGFGIGGGSNLKGGYNQFSYGNWNAFSDNLNYANSTAKDGESVFFRFVNDYAGKVDFSSMSDPYNGHKPFVLDYSSFSSSTAPFITELDKSYRIPRSAFISYNTFEDFQKEIELHTNSGLFATDLSDAPRIKPYNKQHPMYGYYKYYGSDYAYMKKQILEFSVTNNEGVNYIYGLPVFSRNEEDISFGTFDEKNRVYRYGNSQLTMPTTTWDAKKIVGQERPIPYVSSYLLTSIATPDYVDVGQDGFTTDDLGAYTLFTYNKTAGTAWKKSFLDPEFRIYINFLMAMLPPTYNLGDYSDDANSWFRWRTPYEGFNHNRNVLSDARKNMASYSRGERENYYLQTIETKTHIAYFITNKDNITIDLNGNPVTLEGTDTYRYDALEPSSLEYFSSIGQTFGFNRPLNSKIRRLERIELYAKSHDYDVTGILTKKLQTTYFEYDYSLMEYDGTKGDYGLPNSNTNGVGTPPNKHGKLTLRKVWTEYENISEDTYSPYEFSYEYSNRTYPNIGNFGDYANYGTGLNQNPAYNPNNIDRWGCYQDDDLGGVVETNFSRALNMNNWVNQVPHDSFDPAAWHLKGIRLPSGGEIHVYYEQKEYALVQDKPAMAMTAIKAHGMTGSDTEIKISCADLGYNPSDITALTILKDLLYKHFIDNKEKLYFKFLFNFIGNQATLSLSNCSSEYIDGFASVKSVSLVGNDIVLKFASSPMKDLCKDYFLNRKSGQISSLENCYSESKDYSNSSTGKIISHARDFFSSFTYLFSVFQNSASASYCNTINTEGLSYIRIPLVKAKKGGGVRVKSIIMYDEFNENIDSDAPMAYGREYIYELEDGTSSGVASNEPPRGYEENPLHSYIKTIKDQSFLDIYVSGEFVIGEDMKEEFSYPIGESLLPSAHVGYSRVVMKNIFEGATDDGFTVKEYYTTNDYPFDKTYKLDNGTNVKGVEYTNLKKIQGKWRFLPLPFFSTRENELTVTQGYQFIVNNMNGQIRSEYKMGGSQQNNYKSSFTEYTYYEPCEKIPVSYGINDIRFEYMGREVEFFQEGRAISESSFTGIGEYDVVFIPLPFIPAIPAYMPIWEKVDTKLRSHVTTKVIRYPVVLKSTTSMQDGIVVKTENIAFDNNTGQPIITRTVDEFDGFDLLAGGSAITDHDGSYYNYKFVAANEYESMGHKSDNEKLIISGNSDPRIDKIDKIYADGVHFLDVGFLPSSTDCLELKNVFNEGDLILPQKTNNNEFIGYYHVASIQDKRVILEPLHPENTNELFSNVQVQILRSGKTNQVGAIAGNLVTYGQRDVTSTPWNLPKSSFISPFDDPSIPFSQIAARQSFLSDLNAAIEDAKSSSPSPVYFTYTEAPSEFLKVKSNDGSCEILDGHTTFEISANDISIDASMFIFHICTNRGEGVLKEDLDYNLHPLVTDLNNLLDSVWGKDLYHDLKGFRNWFECDCPHPDCENTENYYHWTYHSDINSGSEVSAAYDALGYTKIAEKDYDIMGNIVKGSDIIEYGYDECIGQTHWNSYLFNINKIDRSVLSARMALSFKDNPTTTLDLIRQSQPYADTCRKDTTISNAGHCREFDCKTYNSIGCPVAKWNWPWWRAFVILPYQDSSRKYYDNPLHDPTANNNKFYTDMELGTAFTQNFGRFECKDDGWLYYVPLKEDYFQYYIDSTARKIIQLYDTSAVSRENKCCFVFVGNGEEYFVLDSSNGYQLALDEDEILWHPFDDKCEFCLEFCPDIYPNMTLEGVLQANAVTFSDDWDNDKTIVPANNYLTGKKGKWRNEESYLYKTDIINGAGSPGELIFQNAGVYAEFENIFNWKYKDGNYRWLFVNSIDKYDHDGNVSESSDILDVKSSKRYAYNNAMPIIVANNASNNFIRFESFEDNFSGADNTKSHTGKKSLKLASGTAELIFDNLIIDEQILSDGFVIKGWFHTPYSLVDELDNLTTHLQVNIEINSTILNFQLEYKAQSGEWCLYEKVIEATYISAFSVGDICKISLENNRTGPYTNDVWVDDIKVYPTTAQTNSYVYDRNDLKLLASFDDQHFALMYQYNAKGELVRKLIETERGIKTIAEAQYNTPKIDKPWPPPTSSMPNNKSFNEKGIKMNNHRIVPKYSLSKEDLIIKDSTIHSSFQQNIIDFNVSPDTLDLKLFDTNIDDFKSNDSLFNLNNKIKSPAIENMLPNNLPNTPKIDSLNFNMIDIDNKEKDGRKVLKGLYPSGIQDSSATNRMLDNENFQLKDAYDVLEDNASKESKEQINKRTKEMKSEKNIKINKK
jgi:hypothetical protein